MTILNNDNKLLVYNVSSNWGLAFNSTVTSILLSPPKILEDYIIFDNNMYREEGEEAKKSKNEFKLYNSHKACYLKSDFKLKNADKLH